MEHNEVGEKVAVDPCHGCELDGADERLIHGAGDREDVLAPARAWRSARPRGGMRAAISTRRRPCRSRKAARRAIARAATGAWRSSLACPSGPPGSGAAFPRRAIDHVETPRDEVRRASET
jgi:hypothetical protein